MTACGFTTAIEQAQLQWVSGSTFPAPPATTYLALLNGLPSKHDGTGIAEVTSTRQSITWSAPATDSGGHQYIQNSAPITQTVTQQSAIDGFAVYDASTGGALLFCDKIPPIIMYQPNQSITIQPGGVRVYLTRNE